MSTRAQVRFATREDGVSFSEHPEKIHAQFYVHSDGYPEGLGLDIAMSMIKYDKIAGWEIESLTAKHGDLEYIYYVWQKPDDSTWISIFEVNTGHDNRIELDNLDYNDSYELVEAIVTKIERQFKVEKENA